MNFCNLIKFRKLFLIIIWAFIIYFIQKFIYLNRSVNSNLNEKQNFEIKSELNQPKNRKNSDKISFSENFKVAKYVNNCGNEFKCNENEFSIYINTGFQNSIYPKLCIDDKFLSDRSFNRGINVVTIDNITRIVNNLVNFDPYLKDSTNFETLLLSLRAGDKIILFTFDESIAKLSKVAKLLLHELFGSFHIQNLQFRTAWYLVSEKQIKGYSPYEDIRLSINGQWPNPFNVNFCIPFEIKGDFVKVDQSLFGNKDRVEYCKKFKLEGFCDDDVVNEPLEPLYTNLILTSTNNLLDSTPILIFSDPNNNELLGLTLETVFRQTNIQPNNVLVFYYSKESSNELESLAKLFLFKSFKIDLNSNEFFSEIEEKIDKEFPNPKQFILIFGNLILTADFLNYYSQLMPIFWYPNSNLSMISAWNENCLSNRCTDEQLVYRIKGSKFNFKYSIAIKFNLNFYFLLDKIIQLNFFDENQIIDLDDNYDGLIPDFPRIIIANKEIPNMFLDERNEQKISLFENVKVNQIDSLFTADAYKKSLIEFKDNSLKIKDEKSLVYFLDNYHNGSSVNLTIYTNSTTSDKICTIFNLKDCNFNYYINELGWLVRFNFNQLNVLLIKLF